MHLSCSVPSNSQEGNWFRLLPWGCQGGWMTNHHGRGGFLLGETFCYTGKIYTSQNK